MRFLIVSSSVLCLAAAFCAGVAFGASQAKSKVTKLFHEPLSVEFTPDRDILVDLVELPPNTSLDRHWHPGEEFHYYLEGDPEIQIQGKPAARPELGTVGHVPFKTPHRAGAGKSGAKILVFRVHTKGQPWRYLEDDKPGSNDAIRQ